MAMIWARADRAARMRVEYSTVESFASILGASSADAGQRLHLKGAARRPAGRGHFLARTIENLDDSGIAGEMQRWHFRRLKDVDNTALWPVDIEPRPDARPGRIMRSISGARKRATSGRHQQIAAGHKQHGQHDDQAEHAGDDRGQLVAFQPLAQRSDHPAP